MFSGRRTSVHSGRLHEMGRSRRNNIWPSRHDGNVGKVVFIENAADLRHATVHHVRRGDHVGAGLGVGKRRLGQKVQRGVIVHGVPVDEAAMPVIGILAQADVGNHDQIGKLVLQGLDRALDNSVLGVGLGAERVFFLAGMPNKMTAGIPISNA